jgi:hypothetical protein
MSTYIEATRRTVEPETAPWCCIPRQTAETGTVSLSDNRDCYHVPLTSRCNPGGHRGWFSIPRNFYRDWDSIPLADRRLRGIPYIHGRQLRLEQYTPGRQQRRAQYIFGKQPRPAQYTTEPGTNFPGRQLGLEQRFPDRKERWFNVKLADIIEWLIVPGRQLRRAQYTRCEYKQMRMCK